MMLRERVGSRRGAAAGVLACALIVAGPVGPTAAQTATDYVIGAQDVLQIAVFNQADLGGRYVVEADGTFSFPLIGRITAAGLTLREFEQALNKGLADGYFRVPQVTVAVDQYRSQRIFVLGEVRQPGTYPLTGDMSLIEALASAGSTTPASSGEAVIVRSAEADGPVLPGEDAGSEVIRVDLRAFQSGAVSQNVTLRDGDTVFIPRAETIYVFGEVKNPGSYPIQRDTTVLQALSLAGGVTRFGALNRVRVVRLVEGEQIEIRVKVTDVVQPGDTLIVPERFF